MSKKPPAGKCVYCLKHFEKLTWDHVFPQHGIQARHRPILKSGKFLYAYPAIVTMVGLKRIYYGGLVYLLILKIKSHLELLIRYSAQQIIFMLRMDTIGNIE